MEGSEGRMVKDDKVVNTEEIQTSDLAPCMQMIVLITIVVGRAQYTVSPENVHFNDSYCHCIFLSISICCVFLTGELV